MNDYKEYIDKGIEEIHQGKFEDAIENITKSIELKNDWENFKEFCEIKETLPEILW